MDTYKEKYEAALEQAKKELQTCGSMDCDAARLIFRLFPQFRESKDERIRKELIAYHKGMADTNEETCNFNHRHNVWIDWLEKQKDVEEEIEKAYWNADKIQYEKGYNMGYLKGIEVGMQDAIEKQKEDKEYDLDFAKQLEALRKVQREKNLDELIEMRWSALSDNDRAEISKDSFIHQAKFFFEVGYEKQKEQKLTTLNTGIISLSTNDSSNTPELKAENMDAIDSCMLRYLQSAANRKDDDEIMEDTRKYKQKLFDLIQKPAEWSEEDDIHREWILECLADGKRKVPEYAEQYQSAFNWLKSLRPSWKPSEEQMKVLDKAIPVCMGIVGRDEVAPLESLYNDLKKL